MRYRNGEGFPGEMGEVKKYIYRAIDGARERESKSEKLSIGASLEFGRVDLKWRPGSS